MTAVWAAVCGACLATGGFAAVLGLMHRDASSSTDSSPGLWTSGKRRWARLGRTDRIRWLAGTVGGVVALALTGSPIALLVVPLLVIALPTLLRTPPNHEVQTLEALDRWVRLLAGSMPTGKSVADAIRATARQAPARLQAPVRLLVARLDDRWTTREALLAFASDLDSPDADAILAALILAAERGGRGAVHTLDELSDATQDRLRALREIEAEREKPRVVVRQLVVITGCVLALVTIISPHYLRPLTSAVGQAIVLGCVVIDLGAIWMMRRRARARVRQRLLATPRGVSAHAGAH